MLEKYEKKKKKIVFRKRRFFSFSVSACVYECIYVGSNFTPACVTQKLFHMKHNIYWNLKTRWRILDFYDEKYQSPFYSTFSALFVIGRSESALQEITHILRSKAYIEKKNYAMYTSAYGQHFILPSYFFLNFRETCASALTVSRKLIVVESRVCDFYRVIINKKWQQISP